jgi:uncharacterized membrane protein YphA (DoxX/SURF4 family)
MLSSIFIVGGLDALRNPEGKVKRAEAVTQPLTERFPALPQDTETLVRINGAVQVGAGALLATGKFRRLAALVLLGSLVPTTYAGHRYWEEADDAKRAEQKMHLLKNLGLAGGLILAALDTEGAPSLGWRAKRKAHNLGTAVAVGRAATGTRAHGSADKAAKLGRRATRKANKAAHVAGRHSGETASAATRYANEAASVAGRQAGLVASAAGRHANQAAAVAGVHANQAAVVAGRHANHAAAVAGRHANEVAVVAGRHANEVARNAVRLGSEVAAPLVATGVHRAGEIAGPLVTTGVHRAGEIAGPLVTTGVQKANELAAPLVTTGVQKAGELVSAAQEHLPTR